MTIEEKLTGTKEPRTAEKWAELAYYQIKTLKTDMEPIIAEAIRLAQDQARLEAIAECAEIANSAATDEDDRCRAMPLYSLEKRLRALLQEKK